MSEDRSAGMGKAVGAATGVAGAVALSKANNASTRQTVINSIGGFGAGMAIGDHVGRQASSLDGLKRTELPDQ